MTQTAKQTEWTERDQANFRAAVAAAEARYVECNHDFGPPNQFGTTTFDRCQKCGTGWWNLA
jgi:hypothetical protein